jgi:Rieske 2Fe-2S family protein
VARVGGRVSDESATATSVGTVPTGLTPTLDAACYQSEEVWQAERDRIWFGQWVLVGRSEGAPEPGDRFVVDLAGESIIVVRGEDGQLRAFYNVCRHRGAELVPPDADRCGSFGAAIRCPYHSWTYGLDGALRRAPFLDGDVVAEVGEIALHSLALDSWGGFVFVRAGGTPSGPGGVESLSDQLGPVVDRVRRYPLAELRVGASFTYDVAANWKLLAENYNECYHCGPVHPELCDLVPSFRRGGGGLGWVDGIPHRDGAWTFTTTGTSTRPPFAMLNDAERVRHKGELIYPNLLLSLAAEHVAAFRLVPSGPAATTVVCDLLFHPDAIADDAFDPSDAADLWDLVNRQDWAVCESVQRGTASRAWTAGWFAPMEDDSADISRWYSAAMGRTRG